MQNAACTFGDHNKSAQIERAGGQMCFSTLLRQTSTPPQSNWNIIVH